MALHRVRSSPDSGTLDALFERWMAECDADGQLDFYGLQTLIRREMVEAGEVLVRREAPGRKIEVVNAHRSGFRPQRKWRGG